MAAANPVSCMTAKDVAEVLSCSVFTVHKMKKEGRIPRPMRRIHNRDLWHRAAFMAWVTKYGQRGAS